MRLFIAVQLNREMKNALITMQNDLYDAGIRGNYTKEENLHLTLAFIGEYPDPERVMEVLESVHFDPIPLTVTGIGSFGDLLWAGISEPEELTAAVRRIRHAMADAGIPFDRKKFRPHVTLLRKASTDRIPSAAVPDVSMCAETISLMKSEYGRKGMIYTEIGAVSAY